MAKGIRFYETGGPEVLRWESLPVGEPGSGEVRVRHVAVGLNFADTYFRTGLYPAPLPAGMGVEAADRKSTRLNSSHGYISYAVFCLKKKKNKRSRLTS